MNYEEFLKNLDLKLAHYFDLHKQFIHCKAGCSACCKKGDYPLYPIELEYLMQGYISLDIATKQIVQQNIKEMEKGGACPFLVDDKCSVYKYRPIICRVHGLAYLCKTNIVKLPYCANYGKNYSEINDKGEIELEPLFENLDTPSILNDEKFGKSKNLYDWLKNN